MLGYYKEAIEGNCTNFCYFKIFLDRFVLYLLSGGSFREEIIGMLSSGIVQFPKLSICMIP